MKRFNYIILCVCATIGISAHAYAQAPGETCTTAIPLGTDYQAEVQNGKSVWYSAWTFDLPLSVYFAPANGEADPAPIVEMDFSCTSGYYEDSILCSLFCKTSTGSGLHFDMPHTPVLSSTTLDDGRFVYYLSLGKQYRDLLLQMGISYNVEAFVKVTYQSAGTIAIAPDDLFNNCVDKAKFMHINDTVNVAVTDKERHVVVPYVQWQEDTIIYKWSGNSPCTLVVANTCVFDPLDRTDGNVIQFNTIAPGDSLKVKAESMYSWVHNKEFPNEAGMYFAKFYSEEPGVLQVLKAPQAPPRANATLLRFDRTYPLNANDTNVYAIATTWNDDTLNTKFTTPTEHIFKMVIATDPDFAVEHVLKEYQFEKIPAGHWQGIYGSDMHEFWKQTSEQYLYIRFICSEATTITPSQWIVPECVKNTRNYISSLDTTFVVKRASNGGNYRLKYPQWVGGDITATLNPGAGCKIFIATDCSITTATDAENLLYFHQLTASNNSTVIPADEISQWADRVGEDGYIYMRIHHTSNGNYEMTLQSTAPPETDPTYPASTIAVVCEGTKIVVNVSKAQTLVVRDAEGNVLGSWDAEPGTPTAFDMTAGNYTLEGKTEKIEINL